MLRSKIKKGHRSMIKKPAATKTRKKREPQKKLSASKKFSDSVVARKVSKDRRPALKKISVNVYDIKGKLVGKISLPSEIFGQEINNKLISQAVRVYLANQRLGTASTKTRGEVKGSTRKIYRQKGTGKARHGSIRAPIFVHGGIVFGPRPRDYSLKLPKKMRRLALFSALSSKAKTGEIKVLRGFEKIKPKTKLMAKAIENLGRNLKNLPAGRQGEKILLVLPNVADFENLYKASRNLEGMQVTLATSLNTYEVLDNRMILLVKDAIDVIKKHFLKKF